MRSAASHTHHSHINSNNSDYLTSSKHITTTPSVSSSAHTSNTGSALVKLKLRTWRKVLYEKQNFPDNYVDPDKFLDSFHVETDHRNNNESFLVSYLHMLGYSSVVIHQITLVTLFLTIFKYIINNQLSNMSLFLVNVGCLVCGICLYYFCISHIYLFSTITTHMNMNINGRNSGGNLNIYESVRYVFVFGVCTRASAPIFQILTDNFSDDTIDALVIVLSVTHLVFYDYSSYFSDEDSDHRRHSTGTSNSNSIHRHGHPHHPHPHRPTPHIVHDQNHWHETADCDNDYHSSNQHTYNATNSNSSRFNRSHYQQLSGHNDNDDDSTVDVLVDDDYLPLLSKTKSYETGDDDMGKKQTSRSPRQQQQSQSSRGRGSSPTGILSLNAALFTALVLASRLQNVIIVALFCLLAVQMFFLLPDLTLMIQRISSAYYLVLTFLLWGIASTLLYQFHKITLFAVYQSIIVFLWFLCSLWLVYMQRNYRRHLRGPWEEAKVD